MGTFAEVGNYEYELNSTLRFFGKSNRKEIPILDPRKKLEKIATENSMNDDKYLRKPSKIRIFLRIVTLYLRYK